MAKELVVLQAKVIEAGEYRARQGAMGKAGPGVGLVMGDRRCLVPMPEEELRRLVKEVSIFTDVEIVIRLREPAPPATPEG